MKKFNYTIFLKSILINKTKYYLKAFFTNIISSIFILLSPIFIKIIIDDIIIASKTNLLFFTLFIFISFIVIGNLIDIQSSYIMNYIIVDIEFELKTDLFYRILNLDYNTYDKKKDTEYMNHFTIDIQNISRFFSSSLISFTNNILSIFIIVTILSLYSFKLLIISLSFFPIYLIVIFIAKNVIFTKYDQIRTLLDEESNILKDIFSNLKFIKLLNGQPFINNKFLNILRNIYIKDYNMANYQTIFHVLTNFLTSLSPIILLAFGTKLVTTGELTIGTLVIFYTYLNNLLDPINSLSSLVQEFQEVKVSIAKLENYYIKNDIIRNTKYLINNENIKSILINNLSFGFNNKIIIRDLNLEIIQGDKIAILGDNGTGKSTFFNLLCGLYIPLSGSIELNRINLKDYNIDFIRNSFGLLAQENTFINDTIYNNLILGTENIEYNEVISVCKLTGAYNFIKQLPDGVLSKIKNNANSFSGGQKRLLALTRLILKKPQIILLDEVLNELDRDTKNNILNIINIEFSNKTIFYITHNINDLNKIDKVLYFENLKSPKLMSKQEYQDLTDLIEIP